MGEGFIDYKGILEKTVSIVLGAFAASIVGMDGIPLADFSKDESFDQNIFDAEIATILSTGEKAIKDTQAGELKEIILTTDNNTIIAHTIGENYFVMIVLRGDSQNIGIARITIRKLVKEFSQSLL
ncbi:roadblock/LC7 domain-containing protein [candidate division WOR-3 bacterium]|nr:roadblock/LC7 domain-containing protein [candidate division WOR-3 bacterium]MCK4575205.1 roadblock/LC7 domain-containing protein [candidate division WOR-3 bacterium]